MRYSILLASISLLIISCTKNKFTTAPQLKFKSMNIKDVYQGDILQIKLSFTDKEGDLTGLLYVNQFSISCPKTKFENDKAVPAFPTTSNIEGEILVSYGYRVNPVLVEPQCEDVKLDTCYFKFVLKDKAGNKSDTVVTDAFVLHKP